MPWNREVLSGHVVVGFRARSWGERELAVSRAASSSNAAAVCAGAAAL
jgi:hypothetical protein